MKQLSRVAAWSTVDGFEVTESIYRARGAQERHTHPCTQVTLVVGGSLVERVGAREERGGPLSVVVKPAGTEHADVIGPSGAHLIQVQLQPSYASLLGAHTDGLQDWRWIQGGLVARRFVGILNCFRREAPQLCDAIEEMLAALHPGRSLRTQDPPSWLVRVKSSIDDRIRQAPRVRTLAAEAGVHPVYLARAFRRHFGCSITEYVRQQRVARAAERVGTSRDTLVTCAHDLGFADQAHFCREFKRGTGITPSTFRRLVLT